MKNILNIIFIILFAVSTVCFLLTCPISVSELINPPNITSPILGWLHNLYFVGMIMIPIAFFGMHMKLLWLLHKKKSDNNTDDK